jgi:hypothetical protein
LDDHPNVTLDVVHDVADNCLGKQIRPTLAEIKEKIWGGFVGPVLPESELVNVEAFLAVFKILNEADVDNPENEKNVTIFAKIKQTLTQFSKSDLTQKGFVFGVIGGMIVGVTAIVIINQAWLYNQNNGTSQLQAEDPSIKVMQPVQATVMTPASVDTKFTEHNDVKQDMQQSLIITGTGNQEEGTTQKIDHYVIDESIKPADLTQNSNDIQIKAEHQPFTETEQLDFAKQVELNQDIIRLLSLADQQFEKKQLMTPLEDSAWQTYQDILRLDPDNQEAQAGINKIKKTYVTWAWIEIQKNNFRLGENLFKKVLLISKDDVDATSGLVWLYKYHKKRGDKE